MATKTVAGRNTPAHPSEAGTSSAEPAESVNDGQAAERPLIVKIRPLRLGFWEYEGTRAQLEAENVIPPDAVWPKGDQHLSFNIGRFGYTLMRTRPDGMKGPRKLWIDGDWWSLRGRLLGGPDYSELSILDQKRKLDIAIYRQTPAGLREWNARWNRYWNAHTDKDFQAFMKLVPGLVPPKRGRKAKARQEGGAA